MVDDYFQRAKDVHDEVFIAMATKLQSILRRSFSSNAAYVMWTKIGRQYRCSRDQAALISFARSKFRCNSDEEASQVVTACFLASGAASDYAIVPVLTVTLVEALIDDLLAELYVKKQAFRWPDARRKAREPRSFAAREKEFEALTGAPWGSTVRATDQRVWDHWLFVRRRRNLFVHGNPYALGWGACEKAYELAQRGVPAFARLTNDFAA